LSYHEGGYSISYFGNEFFTSFTVVGLAGKFGACSGRRRARWHDYI